MKARAARWLAFAALMAVTAIVHHVGGPAFMTWSHRPYGEDLVPLVLGVLVLAHGLLLVVRPAHRPSALLIGSLACGAMVSLTFTAFGVGWALVYRRLLWSRLRPRVVVLFPIVTLIALVALADAAHAPDWAAAHPWTRVVAWVFAVGWFLRTLVVWHEARSGEPRPTAVAFLGYFLFAPFVPFAPYMLGLPKLAVVTSGVAALDPAVQRSGLRWLAYGLALLTLMVVLNATGLEPRQLLIDALRDRTWALAAPLSLLYYPFQVVVENLAAGALLVGLARSFGVAMGPAFDAPLLARSVSDWWRRYNTHFRDLLIALFWYPVALRFRRRPVLAAYLGCAAVFLIGSVPLHWPRPAVQFGTLSWSAWGTLVESVIMTVVVGTALALEASRRKRRVSVPAVAVPWSVRAWLERGRTWLAICAIVFMVGYQATYRMSIQPWEQAEARADAARSPGEAATLVAPLEDAVASRPREPARRAVLARTLALAGRTDAARQQLALAHAFATTPTFADVRALARADAAIRTLDEE